MHPIRISATAHSEADAAAVFSVLKDAPDWPRWSMFDAVEFGRPGRDEPHGVGSIRTFITRVSRATEEVVELVPNRRLAYVLLAGFPFRDYQAVVEIVPETGGSRITWSCSFYPKYTGTGWFWSMVMRRTLRTLTAQLAAAPVAAQAAPGQAA
ncbi:MAG: SRPBCC family protein [Acetobacteraceae bacterium]|nr:SRPBCC family protein [Acetobacteraceae bacterium]